MNIRELYLNLNSVKAAYSEAVNKYAEADLENEQTAAAFTSELNSVQVEAQSVIENAQHDLFTLKVKPPTTSDASLILVLSNNPGLTAADLRTAILYQTTNYTTRKTLLAIAEENSLDVSAVGESAIDTIGGILAGILDYFGGLTIESAIENGASPEAFAEIETLKDIWFI